MKTSFWRYAGGGALTGAANGLFGGGGGMIAVPVLERAAALPALSAHATAIAVILPACIVSGIVYLIYGLVPLAVFLPVAIGVFLGGAAGARLLPNVSASAVTFLFAALMFAAGVKLAL
ncbi:MAG: sulfite exporter TauE/SafE family protein [Clostridia bacterium]|nr:sulfite exporter TauE/SafE family protein [Clostridia bacterium]